MRPAVHATSILRHRGPRRQTRMRTHKFSPRRLLLMVFLGLALFVPGLAFTIVGLENKSESALEIMSDTYNTEDRVYQFVGPSMCTLGAVIMFSSCIYFYCYGTGTPPSQPSNPQTQALTDGDKEEKGSIRSGSNRAHSHHHHHHHHHHHSSSQNNGRVVEIGTPDSECRVSLKGGSADSSHSQLQSRGAKVVALPEEHVPLAKMEDSSDLAGRDLHRLTVPTVFIQEATDISDSESSTPDLQEDDVTLTY